MTTTSGLAERCCAVFSSSLGPRRGFVPIPLDRNVGGRVRDPGGHRYVGGFSQAVGMLDLTIDSLA